MHILALYASTSGHTQFVLETVRDELQKTDPEVHIELLPVERAEAKDLLRGDLVLLGSGTWNTGGREGQLNPHMHEYLLGRAKDIDLTGHRIALVSLGDDRYYFRTRCTEHFLRFIREHRGTHLAPPLIIVNEPYDQEEKIRTWAGKLLARARS